ncbi:hypothetical protein BSL78_21470 [Apostichopus japonicus]|uniref:CCHC-type domain-containing protein n=1 Tax=Stichopus japonicus TaxID=307972 RepID=A0A2G8K128_STIJA|nr:hypothetical protein BSL78_21470 [Apostichopus japonicus]
MTWRLQGRCGESKPRPGEVSFETWKYEVLGVSKEGLYSPSLITPIVRRSRGQPGEVVRFLGPDSTIAEIISKLEQLYGTVESGAVLLQQVYLSRQESNESASDFGRRLQLLILRACDRGGITKEAQDSTLRITYWQGLNDEHLKNVTRHKVEQAQDFGEVMCIIRGAEQEIMESKKFHESRFKQAPKRIQSQSVQENTEKQPKCSEPNDSSNVMNRLMKRLDKLEQREQGNPAKINPVRQMGGQANPRGQFVCYRCGQEGHIVKGCRNPPTEEWLRKQTKRAHLNEQGTLKVDQH